MPTDASTLLQEADCLICDSSASMADGLKLALFNRIAGAYGAVASFVERAGITDQGQIDALRDLSANAVANGWWSKCDLIYPFVGGTALAHSQNLKSSSFTITWGGTVTHDANGITGNGTTGFGNTGYIPSTSGQATLNSSSLSFYRRTLGTDGRQYLNARGASALHQLGCSRGAPNTIARLNDGGISSASEALGFVGSSRTASNARFTMCGGVIFNSSGTSNTIPGVEMYVLASNQNGVTALFSDSNISSVTVGGGLTEAQMQLMAADWQEFQTALGRQV